MMKLVEDKEKWWGESWCRLSSAVELGNFFLFENELDDLSSEDKLENLSPLSKNKLEDFSFLFKNDFPLGEVEAAPLDLCSRAAPKLFVHMTELFLLFLSDPGPIIVYPCQ